MCIQNPAGHTSLPAHPFWWHSRLYTDNSTGTHSVPEPVFVNLLRSPGIDSQQGGPVQQPYLSYWPASTVHRLAEFDSSELIYGLLKHLQIRALGTIMNREKLKTTLVPMSYPPSLYCSRPAGCPDTHKMAKVRETKTFTDINPPTREKTRYDYAFR